MSTLDSLAGELARAREAVAGRLAGVDPNDLAALRRAYDAFAENDPVPEGANQSPMELGGVPCLGVLPKGASDAHAILWLHGGGFNLGSSLSHRGIASQVAAQAACAAVIPDYRLAPEHPYPAALEDAAATYKAILGEGLPPKQIVVAGDSAGGGLAIALMLRLRAEGVGLPAGLLLLSPWVDYAHKGWSIAAKAGRDPFLTKTGMDARAAAYLGSRSPMEAEINLLDADLRGLPPAFIQAGEAEILMSDSTRLAERLGAAGSPVTLEIWPEMFHVFQARYRMLTPARQAVERLGLWTKAHLAL